MPLDNFIDGWYKDRWYWNYEFAWLPHRCQDTGALIWLKRAYRGELRIHGPGDDAVWYQWLTSDRYLIRCLTDE